MKFDLNKSVKMDNRKNGIKVISANENISEGSKGIILEYILEGMTEYYSADLRLIRESYSWINIKCKFNGDPITFGFNFEPAAILGTFVFRGFFYARILLFTAVFEQSVCVLCKISFIFFKVYSVGTSMPMSFVPIKITRFSGLCSRRYIRAFPTICRCQRQTIPHRLRRKIQAYRI